jgi:hypothetical protein
MYANKVMLHSPSQNNVTSVRVSELNRFENAVARFDE